MASIIMMLGGDRQAGMRLLGEQFNAFFQNSALSPLEVVKSSFAAAVNQGGTPYVVDETGAEHELEWTGDDDGTWITFPYAGDSTKAPGQQRKVRLKVQDDKNDNAAKKIDMTISVTGTRHDLLAGTSYLSKTVQDIVDLSADMNDAKKYTLAAVTFSRCK